MTKLIESLDAKYAEYLKDESKLRGDAESISFPKTKEEVIEVVKEMNKSNIPITIQGGKTGICGGAVPQNGHILNLSYMDKIISFTQEKDECLVKVEAGLLLSELKKEIDKQRFQKKVFWPVEPTETSATIGGILATNAKGICNNLYGDSLQYVQEITVIDGSGRELKVTNKDLFDTFIGSEGIYGIIVEATLKLIPAPKEIWGISFFFLSDEDIYNFASALCSDSLNYNSGKIAAVEYFDHFTLSKVEQFKQVATKLKELPDIDLNYAGMIYVEIHGEEEEDIEVIAEQLMELSMENNGDDESTWALSGEEEIEKMRSFRHAAPEAINIELEALAQKEKGIVKLSTDIIVHNRSFGEVISMFKNDAKEKGLPAAIFGHVKGNHVHVNILPQTYDEYLEGKSLIEKWFLQANQEGNKLFFEHGIGKIKKDLFKAFTKESLVMEMKTKKNEYDPNHILNKGTVIDL